MSEKIYVLAGIRWGYSASGHTELTGEDLLLNSLERVQKNNEKVFPSLSYAYHADLRLMDDTPPSVPSVVFVNLSLPAADIPYEIEYVKGHLPCAVFVLYGDDVDFRRCMKELPDEWAKKFQHYFLLGKPVDSEDANFDNRVRKILDEAIATSLRKRDHAPRFYSAFISYSHKDKAFAEWILKQLESYGIRCWLDEKQLFAGDRIHTKVEQAIHERDKILLCASRHSLTSWWVDNEINSVISKEQLLWRERGEETLALIPLNLDSYLFTNEWKSGWKNQVVSRVAPDFTLWEARVYIDAAPDIDERLRRIRQYEEDGKDVLESVRQALESVRGALYIRSSEQA